MLLSFRRALVKGDIDFTDEEETVLGEWQAITGEQSNPGPCCIGGTLISKHHTASRFRNERVGGGVVDGFIPGCLEKVHRDTDADMEAPVLGVGRVRRQEEQEWETERRKN